jgi:uncharacterized damage-inducible protein DinB
MDAPEMVANALTLNANFVNKALNEFTDEELQKRPGDHCNPIGWTLWHQYRVEDNIISTLSNSKQTWVEGGWHAKFGMEADPALLGVGNSMEQVMALKPTVENLKGYAAAVREKTLACLKTMTPADLDRDIPAPDGSTRKAGDFLGILMLDHFHHSGQVCYLGGYLTGSKWLPR